MLQFEPRQTCSVSTLNWDQPSGAAYAISEGLQLGIALPGAVADELFWSAAQTALEARFRTQADALVLLECIGMYGALMVPPVVSVHLVEFFDCVYGAYDRCCANVSLGACLPSQLI